MLSARRRTSHTERRARSLPRALLMAWRVASADLARTHASAVRSADRVASTRQHSRTDRRLGCAHHPPRVSQLCGLWRNSDACAACGLSFPRFTGQVGCGIKNGFRGSIRPVVWYHPCRSGASVAV